MQLMYLVAYDLCQDPLEELTTRTESAFRKKVIKLFHGRFVHVDKYLTDLQISAVNCTKMRLTAGLHPDPL